ncbi:MAG: histidine kinase [Bacteroidetes bacterium]|nr:histidine kinase [Bacteroidota bacterium]
MKIITLLLFALLLNHPSTAKLAPLNVKHLTVAEGLNDGIVNAICKDKFGFMWVATTGALNRYDGKNVKKYTHIQGDSTSAPNSSPITLTYDQSERLWIGYSSGLVEFDYSTETFKHIQPFKDQFVYMVHSLSMERLLVSTTEDIYIYNIKTNKIESFIASEDKVSKNYIDEYYVYDYCLLKEKIYFSSDGGVLIYNINTKKITFQPISPFKGPINRIFADAQGLLWMSDFQTKNLYKVNSNNFEIQNKSFLLKVEGEQIAITDFTIDKQNNLWMMGSKNTIIKLNSKGYPTYYEYNNQVPTNLLASGFKSMYCSVDGYIWFININGLGYFHPDENIFDVYFPYKETSASKFAKVLLKDRNGNIWSATPTGLSVRNDAMNKYEIFNAQTDKKNRILSSIVNCLSEDKLGNIWIATSRGVNRYNNKTNLMESFSIHDSLPQIPYFTIFTDHENTVWFGAAHNNGLYYFSYRDNKFRNVSTHPLLKKYMKNGVRCIYEDSQNRLWLGFDGQGLGMYDKNKQTTSNWFNNDFQNEKTISGNLIIDIREDKVGYIWISTHNGITGINTKYNLIKIINNQNGLNSNYCGPLAIDHLNRLWVGTSSDLVLISSDRKNITNFNQRDGLISSSFFEYQASITPDGFFYFPTVKGFVKFHPSTYIEKSNNLEYYLTSYSIFNKENLLMLTNDSKAQILLEPNENYFSFNFTTPYYKQSQQITYAYKLENFDKDWNYSTQPRVNYTNVPPGNYSLIYKASINENWPSSYKSIDLTIKNYFYRTVWFRTLISSFFILIILWIYRFRINNLREVAGLNERAQLLEKEKSVVQYENLKQQLNPHFLFNSLTSLNSLISTEPKIARQFVDQMSKIYRYILKSSENETVPLVNEINFAKTYVQLQQTRFSEGFEVNININEEYFHQKIVPVTIQNLIENAIKHNIIDEESPLVIDIYVKDEYLVVKNNLQKKNMVETSNKHGLNQLKSFYRFLSDKPVLIEENENSFIIKIPLI